MKMSTDCQFVYKTGEFKMNFVSARAPIISKARNMKTPLKKKNF